MQRELIFWVWLAERLGLKSRDFRWLIMHYDSAYELFHLEDSELDRLEEITERTRERLSDKDLSRASAIVAECEQKGIGILPYGSEDYPLLLKDLRDPPIVLYYRGTLPRFNERLCIAMVGTRNMSEYGLRTAYKLSFEMARCGALVVSGMAAGIDGVSAAAAILAGGDTVAVLGCGVDVVYPRHHATLCQRITEHGAVISEYAPGTRPNNYHFPARNRIISGLSQGTVVVEAGLKSGTLITARDAITQGRDVFAVPANVNSAGAQGTNGLLRDGANLLLETEDLFRKYTAYGNVLALGELERAHAESKLRMRALAEMGVIELVDRLESPETETRDTYTAPTPKRATKPKRETTQREKREEPEQVAIPFDTPPIKVKIVEHSPDAPKMDKSSVYQTLSELQLAILRAIPDHRPITPDELARLEYPYGEVVAALTMLEILGLIRKLPGALYTKV